ncbi:hypothetical protein HYH02_000964 [Chlamydomonas schloesseri]|uniref:Uncharacterized protein n=1 Tax=Chlamydomonas schloesseri TaxID=2026947 RepID=A0A835WZ04_9CHLO|nr:hypothetical protein HYH02_000964 [Chlamydomonas schloesseri]|eukprot:KAG2455146.1 hypothetical protein HYH02_000964 [Chlamydomonas schloesseri]
MPLAFLEPAEEVSGDNFSPSSSPSGCHRTTTSKATSLCHDDDATLESSVLTRKRAVSGDAPKCAAPLTASDGACAGLCCLRGCEASPCTSADASPAPSCSGSPASSGSTHSDLSSPPGCSDSDDADSDMCFARGAGGCTAVEDGLLELSERSRPESSSSSGDEDDDGHFGGRSRYRAADADANCADSAGCSGQLAGAGAKRRCVGAAGTRPAQRAAAGGLAGSNVVCVPKHLWRADDLIGRKMVLF